MGTDDDRPEATRGEPKDTWSVEEDRRLGDAIQAAHDRDAAARALRRRLEEGR
nr:hypothetical protein [Micromonospora sp. DSM 115978]